jgi:hypothetical protein
VVARDARRLSTTAASKPYRAEPPAALNARCRRPADRSRCSGEPSFAEHAHYVIDA